MNESVSMTMEQQSTGQQARLAAGADDLWRLDAGQPLPLVIGPGSRVLRLVEGRLWVTLDRIDGEPPEDIWLKAGDALPLAAGSRLLADAHPRASFRLSEPPEARRGLAQRAWHKLQAVRSGVVHLAQ